MTPNLKSELLQIQTQIKCLSESFLRLSELIEPQNPIVYTPKQIETAVCSNFGLLPDQLKSLSKEGNLEFARPIQCLLLFNHVSQNKIIVAKHMGRKSHNSTTDYLAKANGLISTGNKQFVAHLERVRFILKTM